MQADSARARFDPEELDGVDPDAELAAEYANELRAEYEADMAAEFRADMLADMPSPGEIAEMQRHFAEWKEQRRTQALADEELAEFTVDWDTITQEQVDALRDTVDSAHREEDVQEFLTAHPQFLIQHISGGHGRFVLPKPSLGGVWIPDYLLVHEDSEGVHWHGLELESPKGRLCTNQGQPTADLTHAVQQITDWRAWIRNNIAMARQPKRSGGSGLIGIDAEFPSTVLMGRRQSYPPRFNDYRKEMANHNRIEIHSYDWLIDEAQHRVKV